MKRDIVKLAIKLLDKPNGMIMDEYDLLKTVMLNEGGSDIKDVIDAVVIDHKNGVAYLDEVWVEENFAKFE